MADDTTPTPASQTPPTATGSSSRAPEKQGHNISVGQILGAILLILVVVFIVENTRKVKIRIIAGPELNVPVYVAILIAAVVGALVAALLRYRRKRQRQTK